MTERIKSAPVMRTGLIVAASAGFLCFLLVAGCGSAGDNFGEGFNSGWEDGGVEVVWQADTGASARGLVPGIAGDDICVLSPNGGMTVLGAADGDVRSAAQVEEEIVSGGNCARGRIAAVLKNGHGVMIDSETAKILWRVTLPAPPLGAPLVIGDSTVFALADGHILAFSAYAGEQLWALSLDSSGFRLSGLFEPLQSAGRIYIGLPTGEIIAMFVETGVLAWQERLVNRIDPDPYRNLTLIAAPALTEAGGVCAAAFRGDLACFDRASGRTLWREPVSSLGAVAVGRYVYVVDESGALQARDPDSGELRWTTYGASADRTPALAIVGGNVVVADGFQGLSVYSEAGGRIGGLRLGGEPIALRAMDDGNLLVLTDTGNVSLLSVGS